MKLNPDCVRALLIAVESVCDIETCYFSNLHNQIIQGNYSDNEINYHARQCHLSGLIYDYTTTIDGNFYITDLSPAGHEFLANIRQDTIWKNIKSISAKVGSESLRSLTQISAMVISEIIKKSL